MARNFLAGLVVLVLTLQADAQTITLKNNFQKGQVWSFEQNTATTVNVSASANGQILQQAQQTQKEFAKGSVEVLDAAGGIPTSVRLIFDPSMGKSMESPGMPPQQALSPLASKTITVTRNGPSDYGTDYTGEPDPDVLQQLIGYAQKDFTMLPDKPVAVGEQWNPPEANIRKIFNLTQQDQATMQCKLASVSPDGRTAEIDVTASLNRTEEQVMTLTVNLTGKVHVDVASGQLTSANLRGPVQMNGTQQMQTPQGVMAITMQGAGEMTLTQSATLKGGAAPMAGGMMPGGNVAPPPVAPGGMNPLGAVPSYAGKFSDGNLIADLTKQADGTYAGTLQLSGNTFKATATESPTGLTGKFSTADGAAFDFTASLNGNTMTLTSGDTNYKLQRQAPPAPAAPRNPLGL